MSFRKTAVQMRPGSQGGSRRAWVESEEQNRPWPITIAVWRRKPFINVFRERKDARVRHATVDFRLAQSDNEMLPLLPDRAYALHHHRVRAADYGRAR